MDLNDPRTEEKFREFLRWNRENANTPSSFMLSPVGLDADGGYALHPNDVHADGVLVTFIFDGGQACPMLMPSVLVVNLMTGLLSALPQDMVELIRNAVVGEATTEDLEALVRRSDAEGVRIAFDTIGSMSMAPMYESDEVREQRLKMEAKMEAKMEGGNNE